MFSFPRFHLRAPKLLRIPADFERDLRQARERIIADARSGRASTAGAEWLLENYSFLRGQIRDARESMSKGYLRRLPLGSEPQTPRVYEASATLIDTARALNAEEIESFFERWQQSSILTLAELWAIRPMLKLVLLQRLGECIREGRLESPDSEQTVRGAITQLRRLEDMTWPDLVEELCIIDRTLRKDPAGAYAGMDFETRDRYRRAIEELARANHRSENDVAECALQIARQSGRHVGFYLLGPETGELRRAARLARPWSAALRETALRVPSLIYVGGIVVVTLLILAAVQQWAGPFSKFFLTLLLIPASQSAVALVNLLASHFLQPRVQARMDFCDGVPDEFRTLVVVPTLLLSKAGIDRLIGNLEICFLANRDRNISFGLLTDLPDSKLPGDTAEEREIVDHCVAGIHELNRRYASPEHAPFFLFHRDRCWNESEGVWMGEERKRGKLEALNAFLLRGQNTFAITVGELTRLRGTAYVITLDSDTQLPRDTAKKLVGNMAHPLNRPILDEGKRIVGSGYGLMQPRIGISMESANRSRLAAIYSGNTGFDPYTRAVSDVYQDLFGQATFTGKGIYDVAAFNRATEEQFPPNALLSHDLLEGEHVRTGLITDLELIDDYPTRYQALSKRKHRWARGDWQIALWMLPRVPDSAWRWVRNPLPFVSRWKIFDNLRRSLVEPAYLAALISCWFFLDGRSAAAVLATISILALPAFGELIISALRPPPARFLRSWTWTRLSNLARACSELAITLIFLPAQAYLMLDAILRTGYRRIISHQNLLEWESMAQSELAASPPVSFSAVLDPRRWMTIFAAWNLPERTLALSVVTGAIVWLRLVTSSEGAHATGFFFALVWMASPFAAMWLNRSEQQSAVAGGDAFLRDIALATWRYFEENELACDHWLVPDNIQLDPPARAQRTSPTNIGLQLNALVAAHRFGYLTRSEFAQRTGRLRPAISSLERLRGHLLNWYDTRTLQPLLPRFVSTVDSGNLAASLVVLRQGCLALLDEPVIDDRAVAALRDGLRRMVNEVPASARTVTVARLFESLRRQLDTKPDDLFFFEGVLTEVRTLADQLRPELRATAARIAIRAPETARKIERAIDSFNALVESTLADLGGLAPWLNQPFETELRMNLNHRALSGLMHRLRTAPKFSELPEVYAAVVGDIEALTTTEGGIHSATVATLRELRAALTEAQERQAALQVELRSHADWAESFSAEMDFRFLFDRRRNLFRIGWDVEKGELAPSFYDLLASEARTAIFIAIARGHAPGQAWFHLGRTLTYYRGHRTLMSWSGTMFEYLMPLLFLRSWPGTLLAESSQGAVRIQRLYARERRIPWGISESAHTVRDASLTYQYRAFGVPVCGLDRISTDDLVVAPYASVLSLMVDRGAAIENLRYMASRGWLSSNGFFEAIDFRSRPHGHRKPEVVQAFMAHHQGMSLLALANVLYDGVIQKLFHAHPAVLATELLLQERMPALTEKTVPEKPLPSLQAATASAAAPGDADIVRA